MANCTILLIDYEPRSIERFREPLIAAGYTIEIATDGISGIEAFHRLNPDMVLVEAMIPKKHGFEVCQELKRTPHGRRTPVLITTGVYKGRKYRTQALHIYGCDEYIEKPIAPEQLLKIVGKFFGSATSAPPSKAPEPSSVPTAAPSAEPSADDGPRTRLASVPQQTVAEDGAEDEITARLDAILPGGSHATEVIAERETVASVAATELDPFAQMRAELDAELGSLSAALAFDSAVVPSDQVVSPSVLETLPVPEAEIQVAPTPPPAPVVADERPGQVVDFVPKRHRKNTKSERQGPARPSQVARALPTPKPVEVTLPRGTIVASELEPAAGRSGMPTWLWAGLGLVAIATAYFVFARGGSDGDDAARLQPASRESVTLTSPVARKEEPPAASTPVVTPSGVPAQAQGVPDSSKPVPTTVTAPAPKKTPDRPVKPPVAPVPAAKLPVAPPAAAKAAKSASPRVEPVKVAPTEAAPPSGPEENVAGVETVSDPAPAEQATTIAPGTLIPIDEADTMPVALSRRLPVYPLHARQMRMDGAVVMNVLVNEHGTVDQVVLVTGVSGAGINDAAMRAAQSWTYRPATKNGVPVKVWKSEQIVFKL